MRTRESAYPDHGCHICMSHELMLFSSLTSLHCVTSDCRPWHKGEILAICPFCDNVQKVVDENFESECKEIYSSYSMYPQGQGNEQRVFEQLSGLSQLRSEALLTRISTEIGLSTEGSLLDIGCGNGNLLRSFAKIRPSWSLAGLDVDDKNRDSIEQIENVEGFFTRLDELDADFDMITLLHTFEHIIDPGDYVWKVRDKLKRNGLLLIEVPNYRQNPFDLIIADHCSHFGIKSLESLLSANGFDLLIASESLIPKELTVVARKSPMCRRSRIRRSESSSRGDLEKALHWLEQVAHAATQASRDDHFGLFGTSIAGTWLFANLSENVDFFVDEDPSRINRSYMGRNVYHPKDAPGAGNVFICLPYSIACEVSKRMSRYRARFHVPPAY